MKSVVPIQGNYSDGTAELRLSNRRARLGYVLVVMTYALLSAILRVEPVPWYVYAAGVLVFAVCLFPITRWYMEKQNRLPMFELICLSYALQFSTPFFLQPNFVWVADPSDQIHRLQWDYTFGALAMTALGVGIMIVAFNVTRYTTMSRVLPHIDLELAPMRRWWYVAGALAVGLPIMVAQTFGVSWSTNGTFGALLRILANQIYVAMFILGYQIYIAKHSQRQLLSLLYYALIAAVAFLGLISGALESFMVPMMIFFVIRWYAKRKLPWGVLIAGVLALLLLNSVKLTYRTSVWYSGTNPGLIDRVALWADLVKGVAANVLSGDIVGETIALATPTASRFDLLHKFAYVLEMTPGTVPYYEGETYSYFLAGWVPRFLWPDKPSASAANHRMDIDYRRVYESQTSSTTMSIGQLPEAYANFGVVGILVVMSLQGIIFGALDWMLNGPQSEGGRGIYLSILVFFLNGIGSIASIWFGALFQNVVANALILLPFAVVHRARASSKKVAQQFSLE